MAGLKQTRKQLTVAIIVLALLDVAAVAVLFSPLVGSGKTRLDELGQLRLDLKQKQQQVNRVGDIDQKIATAQKQIDAFYKDRLPERASSIADNLGKLATESGVKLDQVKYDPKDETAAGLRPVEIEAGLSGQYPQLARFLNSLERNQPVFFIVDSVALVGGQNNSVVLQMKLRTFLKTGA